MNNLINSRRFQNIPETQGFFKWINFKPRKAYMIEKAYLGENRKNKVKQLPVIELSIDYTELIN